MSKLGYLVSQYPAISHTFVFREVEGLRALGLDIKTASINPGEALLDSEKEEKDSTFVVKKGSPFVIFKRPLKFINTLTKAFFRLGFNFKTLFYTVEAAILEDWCKKNEIFHLHVHFANPAATVALILYWFSGIPYSITIHGPDEFYDCTLNHLKLKFEEAKFLIAISQYTKSQILKIANVPVEVIPLGINPEQYPFTAHHASSPLKLLSVGRLHHNKGFKTLIEACTGLDVVLTIIGEGPERKELEKIASKNIVFKGALNRDDVKKAYENHDLFVLASYAEGLPVVLMEAMASGIPVVTTTVNAITELIENGKTGLLVPPASPRMLKEAILYAMHNPDEIEKMTSRARKKVEVDFNLDTNLNKLAAYMREKICSSSS